MGCSCSSLVDDIDLYQEHDSGDSEDGELVDLPKELSDLASKAYDFLMSLTQIWRAAVCPISSS